MYWPARIAVKDRAFAKKELMMPHQNPTAARRWGQRTCMCGAGSPPAVFEFDSGDSDQRFGADNLTQEAKATSKAAGEGARPTQAQPIHGLGQVEEQDFGFGGASHH